MVYEKTDSGLKKVTTTRESVYMEKNPAQGNTRLFMVSAFDKDGLESDPSEMVTVK